MGEFGSLFKKNFLLWKRNAKGCCCETLTLFVFMLLLLLIVRQSEVKDVPNTSYLNRTLTISPMATPQTPPFPNNYVMQIGKITMDAFKKNFTGSPFPIPMFKYVYLKKMSKSRTFHFSSIFPKKFFGVRQQIL